MATRKPEKKKRTILILTIVTLSILSIMYLQTFRSIPQPSEIQDVISDSQEERIQEELRKIPGGHVEIEGEIGKTQTEVEPKEDKEEQPPLKQKVENPVNEPEKQLVIMETPVKQPRLHQVEKGETLSSISKYYYGTPNGWRDIYEANKDKMVNKNRIRPGAVLVIPDRN